MTKLFGTDGIRGAAGEYPLDPETLQRIGYAVATHFQKSAHGKPVIPIGRDTRESGPDIEAAVSAGIRAAGLDVLPLGILPTPGVAYLTRLYETCGGIVISASHNPFQDNGIKLFNNSGYKLSKTTESEIETLISDPSPEGMETATAGKGGIQQLPENPIDAYLRFLRRCCRIPDAFHGVKMVLDCSNGATSQVAPRLFHALGADVSALSVAPDGRNINEGCGSEHPKRTAEHVRQTGAAIGLAFDGDGDRMIAVDETGAVLTGDQILAICAAYLKKQDRLPNDRVVSTVMSNIGLNIYLKSLNIHHVQTDVGDRHVMEAMREQNSALGGEDSGHMIFFEDQTTGDGIVSALHLLEVMLETGKPLSELKSVMTVFPQHMINVEVSVKPDIENVTEIRDVIDRVKQILGGKGRVLVRYSGTQAVCRVMVEGPSMDITKRYCQEISEVVEQMLK